MVDFLWSQAAVEGVVLGKTGLNYVVSHVPIDQIHHLLLVQLGALSAPEEITTLLLIVGCQILVCYVEATVGN